MRVLISMILAVYSVATIAATENWSNVKRIDCELQSDRGDRYTVTPISYTNNSKQYAALTGSYATRTGHFERKVIFYEVNVSTLADGSQRIQLLNLETTLQVNREVNLFTPDFQVGFLTYAGIPVGLPGYGPNHFPGPNSRIYDCKIIVKK